MSSTKNTSKTKRSPWIAERALVRHDVAEGRVMVRLGHPEPDPDCPYGKDWRCPFVIEGLGDDTIKYSHSIDSMAALQNAVAGIRNTLTQSGIALQWPGFDADFTGFPVHVPWELGLEFYHRLEKIIEAEIEAHTRAMRERHELEQAPPKARRKLRE